MKRSPRSSLLLACLLFPSHALGFSPVGLANESSISKNVNAFRHLSSERTETTESHAPLVDPQIAGKFKILTCSSTSCAAARKKLMQDEYSTYSAFYSRIEDEAPSVQLEECPCLGACKMSPCVGIEHDDFEGTVALEGMTESEFSKRVFFNVAFEEDADRVWNAVENAIQIMAEEEGDDFDEGVEV